MGTSVCVCGLMMKYIFRTESWFLETEMALGDFFFFYFVKFNCKISLLI